jgi:hypothetical protein
MLPVAPTIATAIDLRGIIDVEPAFIRFETELPCQCTGDPVAKSRVETESSAALPSYAGLVGAPVRLDF